MLQILRPLLGPRVLVAEAEVDDGPWDASPGELALVRDAVDKRRQEFAAGRALARSLLTELGVAADFELLAGTDRAPRWPAGFVGSISHAAGRVAVAVARARDVSLLGCDLEADRPLAPELWEIVATPAEERRLAALPAASRGTQASLLFSAKESVFKAQFPLTRRFLEFQDVEVEVDSGGRFAAEIKGLDEPLARLCGNWRRAHGLVATAVAV